ARASGPGRASASARTTRCTRARPARCSSRPDGADARSAFCPAQSPSGGRVSTRRVVGLLALGRVALGAAVLAGPESVTSHWLGAHASHPAVRYLARSARSQSPARRQSARSSSLARWPPPERRSALLRGRSHEDLVDVDVRWL